MMTGVLNVSIVLHASFNLPINFVNFMIKTSTRIHAKCCSIFIGRSLKL